MTTPAVNPNDPLQEPTTPSDVPAVDPATDPDIEPDGRPPQDPDAADPRDEGPGGLEADTSAAAADTDPTIH
jgi:hypothetical protein